MARPEITGKKLATRRPPTSPDIHGPIRLISYKELRSHKGIPYSRSQIRRMEQAGTFPQHIVLGEGDGALIAWIEFELDQYILDRMAARAAAQDDTNETAGEEGEDEDPHPTEEVRV